MKNFYLNAIFQLSAIFVIVGLFIFDGLDVEKIKFIFKPKIAFLLIYLFILKIVIAYLFFIIINFITEKKNSFGNIASTFLQGGIVNQLLPAAGLLFKYYKFKHIHSISLAQYSTSQAILSISSLLSYVILASIFGFLMIVNFNTINFLYIVLSVILLTILFFLLKNKLYLIIRNNLLKVNRISSLINELINIKKLVIYRKKKLLFIFFGFLFLAALESAAFYFAVYLYEVEMNLIKAIFLYLNTSLLTIIFLINFIGLFEIILVLSSSLILSNYTDMIYISLGFKVLNTLALVLAIIFFSCVNTLKKYN